MSQPLSMQRYCPITHKQESVYVVDDPVWGKVWNGCETECHQCAECDACREDITQRLQSQYNKQ